MNMSNVANFEVAQEPYEGEKKKGFDKTAAKPDNLKSLPLPPKVQGGLPLLGRGLEVMKNPLNFMLSYEKKLGDCYRFKVANREYFVMTNVDASEFAARHGKDLLKSGALWESLMKEWDMPNAVVGIDGPKHTEARRLFKPKMSKDLAVDKNELFEEVTKKVFDKIKPSSEVSVRNLTRYLVNTVVSATFNGSNELMDRKFAIDAIDWQTQTFNMHVLKKWPKIMKYRPSFRAKDKKVWKYVDEMLKEKEESPGDDFASFIVSAAKDNPQLFETKGDVNFGILAPLFAGADTVGTTSSFLIQELCYNPEIRRRVVEAVDKAVEENDGKLPGPEFLKENVPELYGVCMETLRLYPTAFSIGRTATQDFAYKGYRVPKGSEVLIVTTAAHFDKRFYKDPQKFDIDRYKSPREEHKTRYAFLPYGVGSHVCLGAGFSELMFLTVAATIIYNYEFETTSPSERPKQIFDPSLGLETKFKIRVRPRVH